MDQRKEAGHQINSNPGRREMLRLGLIILFLFFNGQPSHADALRVTIDDAKEVVRVFLGHFEHGNIDNLTHLYYQDAPREPQLFVAVDPGLLSGHEAINEFWSSVRATVDELVMTVDPKINQVGNVFTVEGGMTTVLHRGECGSVRFEGDYLMTLKLRGKQAVIVSHSIHGAHYESEGSCQTLTNDTHG